MGLYQTVLGKVKDLFPGDTVRIQENGEWADFTIVGSGLLGGGDNGVLVIRKELMPASTYFFASAEYEGSTPDRWLSYGYLSILQESIVPHIIPATLTCWDEFNKQSKTISRKCFLLSATEMGFTDSSRIAVEGTAISYFGTAETRKATLFGSPAPYGTRSPMKAAMGNSVHINAVASDGTWIFHPVLLYPLPIRPAFIISGDLSWDMYRRLS